MPPKKKTTPANNHLITAFFGKRQETDPPPQNITEPTPRAVQSSNSESRHDDAVIPPGVDNDDFNSETSLYEANSPTFDYHSSDHSSDMQVEASESSDFHQLFTLTTGIAKLVAMFGSTWFLESTFSMTHYLKNRYRTLIETEEAELKCTLSNFKPDLNQIAINNRKQFHPSHSKY